jgi:putative ABC transport system permease protein
MTFAGLIWKSGTRNRRRVALTCVSVALALFVMVTLVTFVSEIDRRLEASNTSRLVTHHAVIWVFPIPERYRAEIEKIPGVAAVTPLTYYGGIYIDRAHTDFAQFSCDPETLFAVFPELQLPEEQKEVFRRERNSVIVGRRKAERHGWKLGDRIAFKGAVMPLDVELTVRGIFTGSANDEANVYFHHAYLDEAVPGGLGVVSTYWIRADSPDSVARVGQAVDEAFRNTDTPTRTETEKSFQMSFVSLLGNIKLLVATVSGLIVFTILLVTANTMAMTVRERVPEIAVLKSLGFRRGRVLGLLVAEGVLITLTGGVLGCLAARALFGFVDISAYTQGRFQQFDVTWGIVALGLLVSALLGLVSTGLPAYRASSLTIARGLRNVG